MNKIAKYIMLDILKSKVVLAYLVFLMVTGFSIFNLDENTSKGLISLLNIILFIVPLVCLIYATIYIFNSSEFCFAKKFQILIITIFYFVCRNIVAKKMVV